jgi:hypothetical protein
MVVGSNYKMRTKLSNRSNRENHTTRGAELREGYFRSCFLEDDLEQHYVRRGDNRGRNVQRRIVEKMKCLKRSIGSERRSAFA